MKEVSKRMVVVCLLTIVAIGIFLRSYNFTKGFIFDQDQDLYSWIARDIVVNKHLRLSGQMTSMDGIFIGPMYYYIMAVSYAIFNMNPIGAFLPLTLVGVFNILSFYFVGQKFFGRKVGLIAAGIEAFSYGMAFFERWSVPTQLTISWAIWFLYILLEFSRGKLKNLWLYAVLVGLFWEIHIALIPILPLPIVAYFLSKGSIKDKVSKLKVKNVLLALLIFGVVNSPFFIFEIKHNFSQIRSVATSGQVEYGGPSGWQKVEKVVDAFGREGQQRLLFGWEFTQTAWVWVVVLILTIGLFVKRKLNFAEFTGILLWIFTVFVGQFLLKKNVSEYYFTNLIPLLILILSLALSNLNGKLVGILGIAYLAINTRWLLEKSDRNNSYFYRKELVDSIKSDVLLNNYPCIAVNYIADPGVGVGFRYLFWYRGIKVIKTNNKVPIYNIVIPWQISEKEISVHEGRFGVIFPKEKIKVDPAICQDQKYVLDLLPGYTE